MSDDPGATPGYGAAWSATRRRAPEEDLRSWLELGRSICDAADEIALHWFRRDVPTSTKPDRTFVTEADRAIERLVRARILAAHPDHGLVGEEYGEEAAGARIRWFIDPIDGTHNFIRGVPLFGTLLAVEVDGELQVGILSAPALGERWHAARGMGAWAVGRDGVGRPIRTSAVARIEDVDLGLRGHQRRDDPGDVGVWCRPTGRSGCRSSASAITRLVRSGSGTRPSPTSGLTNSIAAMQPSPRTSPIAGRPAARRRRPSRNWAPASRALATSPSSSITSRVAFAAAQATTLPAERAAVGARAPARHQVGPGDDPGERQPDAIALGHDQDVRLHVPVLTANNSPVRPKPVWTSSAISRIPCCRVISRRRGRNAGGGTM
jgi:fructose-1,6-bisphosphatase/inositol monophosphatase family enzyme